MSHARAGGTSYENKRLRRLLRHDTLITCNVRLSKALDRLCAMRWQSLIKDSELF